MQRLTGIPLAMLLLASLAACGKPTSRESATGGNPRHGAKVIAAIGCGACHSVPGISGADGRVGPPLDHIGEQKILAGMLPNTPENMITWLRSPQSVVPGNAMPNLELNEHDARDVAAYLYTLR